MTLNSPYHLLVLCYWWSCYFVSEHDDTDEDPDYDPFAEQAQLAELAEDEAEEVNELLEPHLETVAGKSYFKTGSLIMSSFMLLSRNHLSYNDSNGMCIFFDFGYISSLNSLWNN